MESAYNEMSTSEGTELVRDVAGDLVRVRCIGPLYPMHGARLQSLWATPTSKTSRQPEITPREVRIPTFGSLSLDLGNVEGLSIRLAHTWFGFPPYALTGGGAGRSPGPPLPRSS